MRKHNDFSAVGGGGRRGCILIRNRDLCKKLWGNLEREDNEGCH